MIPTCSGRPGSDCNASDMPKIRLNLLRGTYLDLSISVRELTRGSHLSFPYNNTSLKTDAPRGLTLTDSGMWKTQKNS